MSGKVFFAYICLGSNHVDCVDCIDCIDCTDAREKLEAACEILSKYGNAKIGAKSQIYLTEPQGYLDQAWFHNQVVRLDYMDFSFNTEEEAQNLLQYLLNTEIELGRVRDPENKFGPRCIDMDLLTFGTVTMKSVSLELPHPRIFQRAFVLIPLQEILTKDMVSVLQIPEALSKLNYIVDGVKIFQN